MKILGGNYENLMNYQKETTINIMGEEPFNIITTFCKY